MEISGYTDRINAQARAGAHDENQDDAPPPQSARDTGRASPTIMGVLNVTTDSFSDGGRWLDPEVAVQRGRRMVAEGADIIDVGGESTRPGALRVAPEIELARVLPVVRELCALGDTVSIDTMHASTASACVALGAAMINDVSGGLYDPDMVAVARDLGVDFVAMHWRGGAGVRAEYGDVVEVVGRELRSRTDALLSAGLDPRRLVLDPGIGFAKEAEDDWALVANLESLVAIGPRLLLGHSRKRYLAAVVSATPAGARTAATAIVSALVGGSGVWGLRVHDVPSTRLALDLAGHYSRHKAAWRPVDATLNGPGGLGARGAAVRPPGP